MEEVDSPLPDGIVIGTTGFGKRLVATRDNYKRAWSVKFDNGGRIPKMLQGMFTDLPTLQKRANVYFSK